jgi:hypothetical protein
MSGLIYLLPEQQGSVRLLYKNLAKQEPSFRWEKNKLFNAFTRTADYWASYDSFLLAQFYVSVR